jgi:protein O-GlcNAc transferase
MRVVSFSLFGSDPLYTVGTIRNSELMLEIFPEWEMWVYHDDTVPSEILQILKKNNVKLIKSEDSGFYRSMWRFYPCGHESVEYFISRDVDSRISLRDRESVYEWIDSGKDFHIIRDHPVGHSWVMNAGMWGSKGGVINITNMINQYINDPHNKYIDQIFLRDMVYPLTKESRLVHDEYFNYEGDCYKIKRDRKIDNFAFIGESIGVDDESRYTTSPGDQRKAIIERY